MSYLLYKIYLELKSCRKVAKETGIPYRTVAHNIKIYKEKIRKKFEKVINST